MNIPEYWPSKRPYIIDDSLKVMTRLPDDCFDLILTDPPYNSKNIGPHEKVYSQGPMQLPEDEYKEFCTEWFEEASRLTKTLVFTPGIANICNYPQPFWVLCWHKPCAVSFNRMGGFNAWEPVFIYGKPATKKHLGQDYLYYPTQNLKKGPWSEHPCPKPNTLWEYLVEKFSNEGDIVFDPFLGSGMTLRCCRRLDRVGLGIEINSDYEWIIRETGMLNTTQLESFHEG